MENSIRSPKRDALAEYHVLSFSDFIYIIRINTTFLSQVGAYAFSPSPLTPSSSARALINPTSSVCHGPAVFGRLPCTEIDLMLESLMLWRF